MFSNTVDSLFFFLEAISQVEPVDCISVNHGAIETYHRASLSPLVYIFMVNFLHFLYSGVLLLPEADGAQAND